MGGMLFPFLAGIFVALQIAFNARVNQHIGLWETAALVHGVGFMFALAMLSLFGNGSINQVWNIDKLYLFGGIFGVLVIFAVTKGVSEIGPTLAVAILLVTQLVVTLGIDYFGLFGIQKMEIDFTKPLGIAIMIIGIIVFKLRG